MHSNAYKFKIKLALYSSTLLMKLLTVVESCLKQIITVKLKPNLLLNALLHVRPLTFITEVLRLISTTK